MTEAIIYPKNLEIEQHVLGYLLTNNSWFWRVNSFLKDSHFSEPVHQRIYQAFSDGINIGQVTPLTLKVQFDEDPALKAIDGGNYLGRLMCLAFHPGFDIITAAGVILELSRRRGLIDLGIHLTAIAQDMTSPQDASSIASEVLSGAHNVINDTQISSFRNGFDIAEEIVKNIGIVEESYSSGIAQLDMALDGGFLPGCVYSFAGKPKTGKTILACTLAVNLAMAQTKIGFLSLEMKSQIVVGRMICRIANIYPKALRGMVKDTNALAQKIMDAANIDRMKNLQMCYEPSMEFDVLKQRLHYLVHNRKIKGFILDYWQIVEGCPKGTTDAIFLGIVAQWISAFCKKENVFGIILLQQNEDGTLYRSRGINRATEQLYYIHRCGDKQQKAWLQMEFSRYSETLHVGSEEDPAFFVNFNGPYFQEI